MFLAKVTRAYNATEDKSTRVPYDVDPERPESHRPFHDPYKPEGAAGAGPAFHNSAVSDGYDSDDSSADFYPGSDVREVLVRARRGSEVDHVQDGSKLGPDIRRLFRKKTWQQIKDQKLFAPYEEDPCAIL